ncbi:MAG: response regulator [Spartobacteria bacterium]|nr:response regulator [Spartobacteria bacterium]
MGNLNMLVVDDDLCAGRVLEMMLKAYGDVLWIDNGFDAVNSVADQLEAKKNYDLICLDIMMPEIDGHATLRQIRQLENNYGIPDAKRSKILMVSALGDPRNIMESFAGLSNGYIVKPVTQQRVADELAILGLI